jgi:hypothetical protein
MPLTKANQSLLETAAPTPTTPAVRQTVVAGPIDTNGLPSFGGVTGATTVTTTAITSTAPLVVTAANGFSSTTGFQLDRMGVSSTNLSFTGLSTNGTMYLYVDISALGVLTPGTTTLAPVYQYGGTRSTVSGQATYNINEGYMSVGNGSTAVQTYRVFVGEVTVAAAVVSAIIWYALNGRYVSDLFGYASSTVYTKNHNLGVRPGNYKMVVVNQITEAGYAVNDEVEFAGPEASFSVNSGVQCATSGVNNFRVITASGNALSLINASYATAGFTQANWKFKIYAQRGW